MPFLNYYSKPYTALGLTDKQIAYAQRNNKGKICTKELAPGQYNFPDTINVTGLLNRINWLRPVPIAYKEFKIPKKSGGMRTLHAPDETTDSQQRKILSIYTALKILPDNAVHSFTAHRNCKSALAVHQRNRSRWFLKLDLKDYFGSITPEQMKKELQKIAQIDALNRQGEQLIDATIQSCFYEGSLPQGACTSPFLSNMFLAEFDRELRKLLPDGFCYTRYADDLLISSRESFTFQVIVALVAMQLEPYGVTINSEKTRYGSCNGRNFNLGLMYNKDLAITVGHREKHQMKCRLHRLQQLKVNNPDEFNALYLTYQGKLAYDSFIEPEYFQRIKRKYQTRKLFAQ